MKIIRCDNCPTEYEKTNLARDIGWGIVRIQARIKHPKLRDGTSVDGAVELCPECLTNLLKTIPKIKLR